MPRLENKIALITGGTSGIGAATVRRFVTEGARVAFTGRRRAKGEAFVEQLRAELHGDVHYLEADHAHLADCEHAVRETVAHYGRIDILFNNAGIVVSGTAEATTETMWAEVMNLNITNVWRMSKLVIPLMRTQGGGVIVNNASDWGHVAGAGFVAYCTSKGAVVLMTKAMALDHARENIRINAVCPGDTYVDRWKETGYDQHWNGDMDAALQAMGASLPMGRVGRAEEIANAVLFLASDESSFMTDTSLIVDGGNTAT